MSVQRDKKKMWKNLVNSSMKNISEQSICCLIWIGSVMESDGNCYGETWTCIGLLWSMSSCSCLSIKSSGFLSSLSFLRQHLIFISTIITDNDRWIYCYEPGDKAAVISEEEPGITKSQERAIGPKNSSLMTSFPRGLIQRGTWPKLTRIWNSIYQLVHAYRVNLISAL